MSEKLSEPFLHHEDAELRWGAALLLELQQILQAAPSEGRELGWSMWGSRSLIGAVDVDVEVVDGQIVVGDFMTMKLSVFT